MNEDSGKTHWKRLEEIFHGALDLEPARRADFLTSACGGDPGLRGEVEQLLASSDQTWGFFEKRLQNAAEEVASGSHPVGEQFGDYKIVRLLGEGGMGRVYLASRADDLYEQQVAIKVVPFRSRDLLLRFAIERQILANLVHPNVARLLDAGITASGSPYLVMEYIRGVPLDRHLQMKELTVPQVLELFLSVCGAVEYAHRSLVVHRDIKPANIVVTEDGIPKLLDFGIAKLLEPDRTNPDLTRETERLFTPEYASPEQVRGEKVTTASDVYALGALLYLMLTGNPPFKLVDKTPFEAARVVCDQPPTRPSSQIASRARAASTLRGDLDNIVLKALRKEPERRYPSVQSFAEDIRRYLGGYPVQASSDAWSYRARKFVSRHRAAVIVSAIMASAVLSFAIGTGILARRARRERQIAERERAFLASLLAASTPETSRGKPLMVRDILDQGIKRIDGELASEPEVRAAMLDTVGNAYVSLGLYDEASPILQRALELRKKALGDDHLDVAATEIALGTLAEDQGKYEEAEHYFRQGLSVRQKKLGNHDPLVGEGLAMVGEILYLQSKNAEAEQNLRVAMALVVPDTEPASDVRNYLALVLERKGQFDEAVRLLREAADSTLRTEGGDSPNYVTCLHNLAGALSDVGNLTEAEKTEGQVLEIRRRVSGKDHPDVGYSLNNLGWFYLEAGDWRHAEPYLREGLALNRKTLGEKHPRVAASMNNLGRVYQEKGDFAAAQNLYEQALAMLQATGGVESWSASKVKDNLGLLHLDLHHMDLAEKYADEALELRRKLGGNDSPDVATSFTNVGLIRLSRSDLSGAEGVFRQALAIREKFLTPHHPSLISSQVRLGEALLQAGKLAEAEGLLRKATASAMTSPFSLLPWQTAEAKSALGACLMVRGNQEEGLALVRESLAGLESHPQFTIRQLALRRSQKLLSLHTN